MLLGTIANTVTIIFAAIIGNYLRGYFSENIKNTVMHGISLTVMLIGFSMALKTQNVLIVTLSMVIGGVLGEVLKIEDGLNEFGARLEKRFCKGEGDFIQAFISASLIYCVGAMAILGSIQSGLKGDHSVLFVKSILDGVSAMVFSSSMGIGVAYSALPVFLYQGAITLAASHVKVFLTEAIIVEMSAVGGLLIFSIGINMLGLNLAIKVGNLLPAIFIAAILTVIFKPLPL